MEKMRIEFEEKMAKLNTTTNATNATNATNTATNATNTATICNVVEVKSIQKKNIIVESKICEKKKLLTERIKRKKQEYNAKNNELQQLAKEIEKLESELSAI